VLIVIDIHAVIVVNVALLIAIGYPGGGTQLLLLLQLQHWVVVAVVVAADIAIVAVTPNIIIIRRIVLLLLLKLLLLLMLLQQLLLQLLLLLLLLQCVAVAAAAAVVVLHLDGLYCNHSTGNKLSAFITRCCNFLLSFVYYFVFLRTYFWLDLSLVVFCLLHLLHVFLILRNLFTRFCFGVFVLWLYLIFGNLFGLAFFCYGLKS